MTILFLYQNLLLFTDIYPPTIFRLSFAFYCFIFVLIRPIFLFFQIVCLFLFLFLFSWIFPLLVAETDWFISDWQTGFRGDRGCRDNILLLRVIYDHFIVNNKNTCSQLHFLEKAADYSLRFFLLNKNVNHVTIVKAAPHRAGSLFHPLNIQNSTKYFSKIYSKLFKNFIFFDRSPLLICIF